MTKEAETFLADLEHISPSPADWARDLLDSTPQSVADVKLRLKRAVALIETEG